MIPYQLSDVFCYLFIGIADNLYDTYVSCITNDFLSKYAFLFKLLHFV